MIGFFDGEVIYSFRVGPMGILAINYLQIVDTVQEFVVR